MENKITNKKIAVLGAGFMGTGISQVFATFGFDVTLIYVYDDKLRAKPIEMMKENFQVLCEKDIIEESKIDEILSRVHITEDLEEAKNCDFIFECIIEKLEIKQDYFKRLDEICPKETILASNTSAISITEIAEKAVHKERIIGTHFWKPAYLIPLVEVIKTKYVTNEVVDNIVELLEVANKCPVIVQKDVPGFLANRLQHALFREALSIVEQGIATPKDVDIAVKNSFGMRLGALGPIETMDSGGLDLTFNIHKYLFPHLESSNSPSKLLKEKLKEGKIGFKSGEGLQKWSSNYIESSQKELNEKIINVLKALNKN